MANFVSRTALRSASALLLAAIALGVVPTLAREQYREGYQQKTIDSQKSRLTIRVFKTGLFSAFAHDHEILAPISRGTVDALDPASVKVEVDARRLRVMDDGISDKDRNQIQTTMLGPEVLDSEHFHEIVFQSTHAEQEGANRWTVNGKLSIRGETRPVTITVHVEAGHYTGRVAIKQSDFGIKPVSVAGGTVKVKDELRVEFDIQLAERDARNSSGEPSGAARFPSSTTFTFSR